LRIVAVVFAREERDGRHLYEKDGGVKQRLRGLLVSMRFDVGV